MPKILKEEEQQELINGITSAFSDIQFIGRFLDVFIQSIKLKAVSPGKTLFERIIDELNKSQSEEKCSKILAFLRDEKIQKKIISGWEKELQKNKLRGQTISNIAAVCVEAYLQNGIYFIKGEGSNDLKRVSDNSRLEIKGSRSKEFQLTINQSTVGIDTTNFVLYCGFPERNELLGIYCVKGRDVAFSAKKPNMNMRTFLPKFYKELVQMIYPK
ncbi:MAG: hypothetical protein HY035_01295 [Nitrospirae bacterium]|nr:hypothetical protein [Nitrospirota bacterium]MBI3377024.1 hypothetical protein [Nitrospirota bacterium]